MLGLGNSIVSGSVVSGYSDPSSFSGLALWLGFNQGITAASGNTAAAGNLVDDDKITQWDDLTGNGYHAGQAEDTDRPKWDTANSGADIGSLWFANNAKWMDLASDITIDGDFTMMIRFRLASLTVARCFLGGGDNDLFKIEDADNFKAKMGATTTVHTFEDTSATDLTVGDPDYRHIVTLTRSSGLLKVYVNGGTASGDWKDEQDDVDWDSAESHSDSETLTINNIGASSDDTQKMSGWIYDVLIYDGTVLTTAERKLNYDYLNAQTV